MPFVSILDGVLTVVLVVILVIVFFSVIVFPQVSFPVDVGVGVLENNHEREQAIMNTMVRLLKNY